MSVKADRNSRKALEFMRDQFDREWSLDLYVQIPETKGPPVRMRITNLGKASALVHTILVSRDSNVPRIKFEVFQAIPHGESTEVSLQEALNEFVWEHVTRSKSVESSGEWFEQEVSLDVALGAHSAGRDSDTSAVRLQVVLRVHSTLGSRVDRIKRAVSANLRTSPQRT